MNIEEVFLRYKEIKDDLDTIEDQYIIPFIYQHDPVACGGLLRFLDVVGVGSEVFINYEIQIFSDPNTSHVEYKTISSKGTFVDLTEATPGPIDIPSKPVLNFYEMDKDGRHQRTTWKEVP
jgi:hypothetical protein